MDETFDENENDEIRNGQDFVKYVKNDVMKRARNGVIEKDEKVVRDTGMETGFRRNEMPNFVFKTTFENMKNLVVTKVDFDKTFIK